MGQQHQRTETLQNQQTYMLPISQMLGRTDDSGEAPRACVPHRSLAHLLASVPQHCCCSVPLRTLRRPDHTSKAVKRRVQRECKCSQIHMYNAAKLYACGSPNNRLRPNYNECPKAFSKCKVTEKQNCSKCINKMKTPTRNTASGYTPN